MKKQSLEFECEDCGQITVRETEGQLICRECVERLEMEALWRAEDGPQPECECYGTSSICTTCLAWEASIHESNAESEVNMCDYCSLEAETAYVLDNHSIVFACNECDPFEFIADKGRYAIDFLDPKNLERS